MPSGSATSTQQTAAAAVCSSLHRAYRDYRLYPLGHPTARESLEALAASVTGYAAVWGDLSLDIREETLTVEDEEVYQRETTRDNLAFVMFRDGLRTLTIRSDYRIEDLEGLVSCLAHADDLAGMEHDLVTALWESDLAAIEYQVVSPFMGGTALREGMIDALRETVIRRLERINAPVERPSVTPEELVASGVRRTNPRSLGTELLQLTPEEVQRAERAVEDLGGILRDYAEVLLELAGKVFITSASDAVMQSLAAVVGAFLDEGDPDGVDFVLERLRGLEAQRWCPSGSAEFVASEAVTADRLKRLLESAGQGNPERSAKVYEFLRSVRRSIVGSLLEVLTETGDRSIRKMVLEILGGEGAVPWPDLEPLLRDPRWYVVRNAVHLAAGIGHEELVEHAPRLLGHADVRVRRETVRALGRLNSVGTIRALAPALCDPDPPVRILAANAMGRKGRKEHAPLLLARIEDRTFLSLAPEELEAFLGAYARLAQDRAVPLLERAWKKSLLSSKPAAYRVAAVLALGRVGSISADEALRAASRSDDPQIRRAATDAVQRRKNRPGEEA